MSSRQKSFFDQDHKGKTKPHWSKNRSFDKKSTHDEPATRAAPPRSPIAVSSQSRSKLNAFQYPGSRTASPSKADGKENEPLRQSKDVQVGARGKSPVKMDSVRNSTETSSVTHAKSFPPPSTPAMRLPLADLIGNAEDAMRRPPPKEQSPEEQLGWIPNSSNSALTPGQRRKRAHSSSPLSSSQQETSTHFALREALDLQTLQQSLKTPHADPAADLWSRYATGRNADDTPLEAKLPSLAHLLNDSSPHSLPRTPGGSVGGLRRWASCGIEFPASKAKRRKTHGVFKEQGDDVFANDTRDAVIRLATKVSRVGLLVEQVQATLAQPTENSRKTGPSSSSPLPDKGGFHDQLMVSSHEDGGQVREHHEALEDPRQEFQHNEQDLNLSFGQSQSTEYGDADIVLDAMAGENLPQETVTTDADQVAADVPGVGKEDRDVLPADSASQEAAAPDIQDMHLQNNNTNQLDAVPEENFFDDDDDDEFGDDCDITAEDLDNVMTIVEEDIPPKVSSATVTRVVRDARPAQSRDVAPAVVSFVNVRVEDQSDEEDFGGLDLDDEQFAAAEVAATQAYHASTATQSSGKKKSRAIQRYLVREVIVGQYKNDRGQTQPEKVLLVEEESTKVSKAITLRQSWIDTHCTTGAYVHVVGDFSRTGQITINDAEHLIVVHPDHLVSATAVADSFDCLRKAVLQDRVKATSPTSKPTVYGTILHEVFQVAMTANRWDSEWLDERVQATVVKYVQGLFEAGAADTNEALEHLRSKLPELQSWASIFVNAQPGADAQADDRNGKKVNLSITKLLDVEEHVWSPTYGLKGNIDATVEVVMEDDQGKRNLTVPFEVKTGKFQNAAHRAQTALYTLLLSDRYDVDVAYGILYYMETSSVTRVPAIRNELRHMVMQRNELASYVRERLQLPPMLKNPFKCGRCYAKTSCFLYHKLSEDGTPDTAGVRELFGELVGKLQPAHQEFFKKWDHLLTREESEMFKFKRELWTMLSHEREKIGRCFAEVVIEPGSAHEQKDAQKINRFTYTLIKKSAGPGFSFTESQITTGEPIVVSSEQGHFALANGYVTKVSAKRIGIAVDRRLHNARKRQPGFDKFTNQAFAAIMEVGKEGSQPYASLDESEDPVVYRLDKDEFSNGMATVRNNLLALMDDNIYRSHELRSLIVGNVPPVFTPTPTAYTLSGPASQLQINPDQRAAIDKVMSAQDYALVLGMPGTGKTTTIAHIIRALVARGKSVLLTSYTHTAVDNILLKLRDSDMSILRLGVLAKIHPEVQDFANLAAEPRHSIEELEEMYMTPQVVATTCLGVGHQIFHKRVFDYCIVDEASQITLPVCLGPIRMARTFVLVGDHYQLPPLVQNKEAQEGGLDVSLFKLLSDRQPTSVVNLEHQYRMCKEIMLLSNTLIYSGRLKCGNEAVAQRTLLLPNPDGLQQYHNQPQHASSISPSHSLCRGPQHNNRPCWLTPVLCPSKKVLFLNTDTIVPLPRESAQGNRITNPTEASLVSHTVHALLASGIPASEIGIITFYRSQLALLRQSLKHVGTAEGMVEMHTADKFQGRDKEVVILSCVRSNDGAQVGELLKDWRRVNVALTRARSKLIVVGSAGTLGAGNDTLKGFLKLVREQEWVLDLPGGAGVDHEGLGVGAGAGAWAGVGGTQWSPVVKRTEKERVKKEKEKERYAPKRVTLGEGVGVANRNQNPPFKPVVGAGLKRPDKVGMMGQKTLLKTRPVLKDIVSEVLGEDGMG